MNKNFLKSVITGVVSLGLIASCTQLTGKKEAHKCAGKEAHKWGADKKDANKCAGNACAAAKTEVKTEKKAKKAKAAKPAVETKAEVKTETKAK